MEAALVRLQVSVISVDCSASITLKTPTFSFFVLPPSLSENTGVWYELRHQATHNCCSCSCWCVQYSSIHRSQLLVLTQQVAAVQKNLQVLVTDHSPFGSFHLPEWDTDTAAKWCCPLLRLLQAHYDFLLLGAAAFKQVHQFIQINAAFTLVQLCLPTFELICGRTE